LVHAKTGEPLSQRASTRRALLILGVGGDRKEKALYHIRRPSVDFLEFAIGAAVSADIAVNADNATTAESDFDAGCA
jgi:hypothetical protein